MSKLQEVVAKIRTKAKLATVLADQLHIPASHEDPESALPTDPASIKKWLIAHAAVNSTSSRNAIGNNLETEVETLLQSLQHCNRISYTPSERLRIMDVYEKPFAQAMQGLDSRYLYLDFPLQNYAEKAFQLAATLCREMAFGYKIAIADTLKPQSTTSRFSVNSQRARKNKRWKAIRSANKHLSHLALRHSQINRSWPTELWPDLNALHNIAIQDHSNKIVDQLETGIYQTLTIEQQYASLCALYVLDQNKLSGEQVRALFLALCGHAGRITFHNNEQSIDQHHTEYSATNTYSVGNDKPPAIAGFRLAQPDDSLIYFKLDELHKALQADDGIHCSHGLLHESAATSRRKHSRAKRANVISAETGLQDIHTRISLTPPVEHIETQFTDLERLLGNNVDGSNERLYSIHPEAVQANLLQQSDTPQCSSSFEVENESAGGFGLRWTGAGSCRVQVGELVAHCYTTNHPTEKSWHLSVVRWLRTDLDGTLRFGVEALGQHTKAVTINRLMGSKRTQRIVEGLLINYQPIDSRAEMIILPKHNFKAGETIAYRDSENFHTAQLVESIPMPNGYQCFATRKVEEEAQPMSSAASDQYRMAV